MQSRRRLAAVRTAVESNRQLQAARLRVEKADADVAAARTRRLPLFETEVHASQLLTPVDFAFPRGAFGDFAGTGPIPSVDTTVSVPRQPTYYLSSQVSQPISQLFRIGLGIRSVAVYSDPDRNAAHVREADRSLHVAASLCQLGDADRRPPDNRRCADDPNRSLRRRQAQPGEIFPRDLVHGVELACPSSLDVATVSPCSARRQATFARTSAR